MQRAGEHPFGKLESGDERFGGSPCAWRFFPTFLGPKHVDLTRETDRTCLWLEP